ncbi:tetratricopeptide repeat protein [Paenibacillus wulumuqiensis]|uniref:tetratricopeptide repeat protein n=1 Tax=Paenibacillus wulumuqiensis TaxID=1567107 RepID=UPI000619F540|nr:tetratricopeptide repeat protein [Paenibacillus wulumuqiensis]
MAELEDQEGFAALLSDGITALREHPDYRTRRKKREAVPSGRSFSESYMDRISSRIGVSANTVKSWTGQMGAKYIPSRIEDSKLFTLLWMIMEQEVMTPRWFNDLLLCTSIPVIDPPTPEWLMSCFRKAKVLLEDETYGAPDEQQIIGLVNRLFPQGQLSALTSTSDQANQTAHNLPSRRTEVFIGRMEDLSHLLHWLHSPSSVCLLTGWGGMGKTTIALETAYACLGYAQGDTHSSELIWPDMAHVIWVSAESGSLSLSDFLDTIAYQLGRRELLEKLLAEKKLVVRNALAAAAVQQPVLLIVDSMDTAHPDIHEFVVSAPQGVKILLTARANHGQLHNLSPREMYTITLNGLQGDEALQYLQEETAYHLSMSILPARRQRLEQLLSASPDMIERLIAATAGNPKAISLSIAYLADDELEISQLIQEIERAGYNLSTLFDYLFGRSWERCTEEARQLWQTLGFFGESADEHSWAAAAQLSEHHFHEALRQLRSFALIESERIHGQVRYRAHQTVLAYGEQHLLRHSEREQQMRRQWAEYYIGYLDQHLRRQQPDQEYWSFLLGRDLQPVKQEWPNIMKLLHWADVHNPETLIQLMLRITHLLSRINLETRVEYCLKAARYASAAGRIQQAALFYIDGAGWALIETGETQQALHYIAQGIHELQSSGLPDYEAADLLILGKALQARCYLQTGQLTQAHTLLENISIEPHSPLILHRLLLIRGELLSMEGRHSEAIILYEQANQTSQSYGGEKTIEAYYHLGMAYMKQNDYEQARLAFDRLLYDEEQPNQIELIFYRYGTARLLAETGRYQEAIQLTLSVLTSIESWGRLAGLKREVKAFYDSLRRLPRE